METVLNKCRLCLKVQESEEKRSNIFQDSKDQESLSSILMDLLHVQVSTLKGYLDFNSPKLFNLIIPPVRRGPRMAYRILFKMRKVPPGHYILPGDHQPIPIYPSWY